MCWVGQYATRVTLWISAGGPHHARSAGSPAGRRARLPAWRARIALAVTERVAFGGFAGRGPNLLSGGPESARPIAENRTVGDVTTLQGFGRDEVSQHRSLQRHTRMPGRTSPPGPDPPLAGDLSNTEKWPDAGIHR